MEWSPLWISLKTSICATGITFVLGIGMAYLVMKLKRGRLLIDGILTLPLVLPPTVLGFLLLVVFGQNSPLGIFLASGGISVVFRWEGTVVAASVVSFPLMYRAARGAFEQLDCNLIYVSRTLGISEWNIFLKVILPNCKQSILAGTILSFARTIGEFGATMMLAGNIPGKTQTMATAVYTAVQSGNRALAYRWAVVILLISAVTMIALNVVERQTSMKQERNQF